MLRLMFAFAKSYAIVLGQVVDVLSFNRHVYLETSSPYPAFVWTCSPNYLENKIIWVSICIGCLVL